MTDVLALQGMPEHGGAAAGPDIFGHTSSISILGDCTTASLDGPRTF